MLDTTLTQGTSVFLSYKAEDATLARQIAERLMLSSVSTWMAEYSVPIATYGNESAIESAIREGVAEAQCYVVFSSDAWARSEWCRLEMRLICATDSPRILQVKLGDGESPSTLWPVLNHSPLVQYDGRLETVIDRLVELGWIRLASRGPSTPASLQSTEERKRLAYGITYDRALFMQRADAPYFLQRAMNEPGEHYLLSGVIDGQQIDLLFDIDFHKTALSRVGTDLQGEVDDREIYLSYLALAQWWLNELGREEVGVHLLFRDGRSHFAMTSMQHNAASSKAIWERRYALLVKGPRNRVGELDVSFSVTMEHDTDTEQLTAFVRFGQIFDELVGSIPKIEISRLGREWRQSVTSQLAICWVALTIARIASVQSGTLLWPGLSYFGLGGASAGAALTILDKVTMWELNRIGHAIGPKLRFQLTLGHWGDGMWNRLLGAIGVSASYVGHGLRSPLGWLFGLSILILPESGAVWFATGGALCFLGRGKLISDLTTSPDN